MIFAETERLALRRPRPEDWDVYRRNWSDPDMVRFTERRGDIDRFLHDLFAEMETKAPGGFGWFQLTVARRPDESAIGDIGIGFGVPGERQVELGYRIHPDHQRRGYGREAVAAAIDWLVRGFATHRFVAVAAAPNAPSLRLLRSLGFRKEGHFRQSFLCDGRWIDDAYHALLAEEWIRQPGRAAPQIR